MSDAVERFRYRFVRPLLTVEAFDRIAKALDRDRTWVMLQAFSFYLKGEGGHILRRKAEGIAEARARR